jgi:hypothetical protein
LSCHHYTYFIGFVNPPSGIFLDFLPCANIMPNANRLVQVRHDVSPCYD